MERECLTLYPSPTQKHEGKQTQVTTTLGTSIKSQNTLLYQRASLQSDTCNATSGHTAREEATGGVTGSGQTGRSGSGVRANITNFC